MTDKRIVAVFGGSGGIGSAICKLLSADMTVYATFYEDKTELDNVRFENCDVSKEASVESFIRTVIDSEGRVDCVVNAVTSGLKLLPFDKLGYNDYLDALKVDALGGINIIKHALPYIKQNRGLIVTMLSTAAEGVPPARMSAYITSKYALKGFIKCVRAELRGDDVRIITLSPSFVETDLISVFPNKLLDIERAKLPGKTFIQPEDLARLIKRMIQQPVLFTQQDVVINNREDVLKYV
ncbi:MAG: SDR family NAD(P)-dependent oxidoreductase [Candidatus Omnitrophica bacterium]|nr:SDR family NAD(P)-dependent oxidoreductase [Candidatus Omnitrophota bacterium]